MKRFSSEFYNTGNILAGRRQPETGKMNPSLTRAELLACDITKIGN
jgi:hypothetical protein